MTEYFDVVDSKDKVIRRATREECHKNRSLIHRGTAIIVSNSKGEILLEKRSKSKDLYPGCWGLVGGHVSPGESYEEAARREMTEEIGVKCELKLLFKTVLNMREEMELEGVFSCVHEGPFRVNREESDEVRFFPAEEIKKMMKAKKMPSGDIQVLEKHFSELIKQYGKKKKG